MVNFTAELAVPQEKAVSQRHQPVIEVRNLEKVYRTLRFGDVHAIKDVSFWVADGEFVAIVGPSGCGKSTMLKILAGLLPKSAGEVLLKGKPVEGPQAEFGVVFQSPVLLPWRTVFDNIMIPVEILRLGRAKFQERALSLIRMVGLNQFEKRYPYELSGGMQQRAAIVRALIHDPAILLMDEPFGALDALTREQMNVELLRIWQESKKTILFITHSISEAVFMADRVLVMTPRPGQVAEMVKINLPRPRSLEVINSDRFGAYAQHLRKMLQVQGDLG